MKKIMLCVDLSNESIELLKKDLKKMNLNDIEEFHLIHGFQLQVYADIFYFNVYPSETQYGDVEKSVTDVLSTLKEEINKREGKVSVVSECLITKTPKEDMVDYAGKNDIDQMVIGTRGKHGIPGLFSSSFAEYMVRHAPCELRIIRGS